MSSPMYVPQANMEMTKTGAYDAPPQYNEDMYEDVEDVVEDKPYSMFIDPIRRIGSFQLPGMGMFSESYIIFSAGQIGSFQKAAFPTCYVSKTTCDANLINNKIDSYIQIIGIMAGMMVMGAAGDFLGRKWGSRLAAAVMLSGVIMLCFTPYAGSDYLYFVYFITCQTWYGFGVGGEYPMASSSAAELAEVRPELRDYRGRQVILVFANQGVGNLVNSFVVLICYYSFGIGNTSKTTEMSPSGSKQALSLMYGVGTMFCLAMVSYRFIFLEESEHFANTKSKVPQDNATLWLNTKRSIYLYWPRQFVASFAWFCNDFAFYGNKLQQAFFISLLFPGAVFILQQEWSCLNSFIAFTGYYAAALTVDKPWYGRKTCQNVGFGAMFIIYIIIFAQWLPMNDPVNLPQGMQWFQALYYLSSFFNQFGPNATTWLVAGEIFPTQIRTTNHGIAATVGKAGAIISTVWIITIVNVKYVFMISAIWAIGGMAVTWLMLPDTVGLDLVELDKFHTCMMEGRQSDYTGEAINPKYLSPWELWVYGWQKNYVPPAKKRRLKAQYKDMVGVQYADMAMDGRAPQSPYPSMPGPPVGPPPNV